ncbi:MAG: hypothetical protein H6711_17560 [Myxococcales bacterium]|nr:hypothetical protein [Myxococcales bacterium]
MAGAGFGAMRGGSEAYVASLPCGLDTYPECQVKAGFYLQILAAIPRPPEHLPPPLADLVANPRPISSWIPEVHHQALAEAIAEQVYGSPSVYLRVVREGQRRLFAERIYAPLLQLLSPERLLRQAAKRWSNFHRGTTLTIAAEHGRGATALVSHPPGLFSPIGLESLALGFQAALEASSAKDARVIVNARGRDATTFEASWR